MFSTYELDYSLVFNTSHSRTNMESTVFVKLNFNLVEISYALVQK